MKETVFSREEAIEYLVEKQTEAFKYNLYQEYNKAFDTLINSMLIRYSYNYKLEED